MVVYLMKNTNGLYKIGNTSRNTKKRVKELQTGSAAEIFIVEECECKFPTKVESALHKRFARFRIIGEWFDLPDEYVRAFYQEATSLDKGFQVLKEMDNPFLE